MLFAIPGIIMLPSVPEHVVGLVTVPCAMVAGVGSLNVCDNELEAQLRRVTLMAVYAAALKPLIVYVPVPLDVIEAEPTGEPAWV